MKNWLYPADKQMKDFGADGEMGPVNRITNKALLAWLDKFCPPSEWCINLTGGEPGMYKEIDTLIPALNEIGYHGIIQTNGSLPIPKSGNFKRVAAWHKGVIDCPPYFDEILILKNTADNYKDKIAYCEKNKIPYSTSPFIRSFEKVASGAYKAPNKFIGITTILSMGQLMGCPAAVPEYPNSIFNMTPPIVHLLPFSNCYYCGTSGGVEARLFPKARDMVFNDFNRKTIRADKVKP